VRNEDECTVKAAPLEKSINCNGMDLCCWIGCLIFVFRVYTLHLLSSLESLSRRVT